MENQIEKEITLFDIFDNIVRGWYFFLFAILISLIVSYFYHASQKDIYKVEIEISNINDIEKASLPIELTEKNIFKFFTSSLKSVKSIDDIITKNNLLKFMENDYLAIYQSLSLDLSLDKGTLTFITRDLSNLDTSMVLEEYKILILLLLESRRENSFKILKQKYIDRLTLLDELEQDEEKTFINNINRSNVIYRLNTLEDEKKLKIVYLDLLDRIKNNLQIAIDLGIKDPVQPESTEVDYVTMPHSLANKADLFEDDKADLFEDDLFEENLLTIMTLNDLPLYTYGSFILKRELELLQEKFDNLNDNLNFSFSRIENEINNQRKYQDTMTYIELLEQKSKINRNIIQLELLENSEFQFIQYDPNEFIISSDKLSLYYIVFIVIIFSLSIAFLINLYVQPYRRK